MPSEVYFIFLFFQSRERLLKALRAMNAGDAADQVLRQVEKMMRINERASRDARLSKVTYLKKRGCKHFKRFCTFVVSNG